MAYSADRAPDPANLVYGEMAEWTIASVLKTVEPSRVPGVRIPLSPPLSLVAKPPIESGTTRVPAVLG